MTEPQLETPHSRVVKRMSTRNALQHSIDTRNGPEFYSLLLSSSSSLSPAKPSLCSSSNQNLSEVLRNFQLGKSAAFNAALTYFVSALSAGSAVEECTFAGWVVKACALGLVRSSRVSEERTIAARLISRALSVVSIDRTRSDSKDRNDDQSAYRHPLLMPLSNHLFRLYFHLNTPRMSDTVIANTRKFSPSGTHAETVEWHYWLGRIHLSRWKIRRAHASFRTALALCPAQAEKSVVLIAAYLVPVAIILGYLPSDSLQAHLRGIWPSLPTLVQYVREGRGKAVRDLINQDRALHISMGTYVLLLEKLEVIVWRNLIRTLIVMQGFKSTNKVPVISFDSIALAAQVSFADDTIDKLDAECICASLIGQEYLKAYILHSRSSLVLQKGDRLGVPPVHTVFLEEDKYLGPNQALAV